MLGGARLTTTLGEGVRYRGYRTLLLYGGLDAGAFWILQCQLEFFR